MTFRSSFLGLLLASSVVTGAVAGGGGGGNDERIPPWTDFIPTEEACPKTVDYDPLLDNLEKDIKRLKKMRNRLFSLAGDIAPSPTSLGPNLATTGRDLYGLYDDAFGKCN